jgi:hypothetical protein
VSKAVGRTGKIVAGGIRLGFYPTFGPHFIELFRGPVTMSGRGLGLRRPLLRAARSVDLFWALWIEAPVRLSTLGIPFAARCGVSDVTTDLARKL